MHPCFTRLFGTLTIRQRRPDGLTSRKPFGACVIPAAQPNIRPNIDLQCGYSATNQTTDLQRTAAPCAEYSVCGMSMCSRECRTIVRSCALKLLCESGQWGTISPSNVDRLFHRTLLIGHCIPRQPSACASAGPGGGKISLGYCRLGRHGARSRHPAARSGDQK
jgi:hypothetical protein